MDDDNLVVELMDMEDEDRRREEEWQQLQEGLRSAQQPEETTAGYDDGIGKRGSSGSSFLWIAVGIGIAAAVFWLL